MHYLSLTAVQKYVLHVGYGLHEAGAKSWEMESDGETLVKDKSILGNLRIKNPAGVVHDFLNRVPGHRTPDGHVWTPREANCMYRELLQVFGYSRARAWLRWVGVTVSVDWWWRQAAR